jgi:creatinine amidohydrolase
VLESELHGHACECETSISLANHPELVKMDAVPAAPGDPHKKMAHLAQINFSGVTWYSDYPEHYAGDARTASAEKGRILRQLSVDALSEFIAAVKADQAAPALQAEFFARVNHLGEE